MEIKLDKADYERILKQANEQIKEGVATGFISRAIADMATHELKKFSKTKNALMNKHIPLKE